MQDRKNDLNPLTHTPTDEKGRISFKRPFSSTSTVETKGPNDEETEEIVIPPDGGYGYVVVFAAFVSMIIVDGVALSFGILKDSVIEESLKESQQDLGHATVAWMGSVMMGFYFFGGPFVAALANKYGFRKVTVGGSVITSTAFILSWYLNLNGPNIGVLIVFYGIIGGLGFSCIYMAAVVVVGLYFDKKRAFATGIAVCGSGFGNFIFPPIIAFLIDRFQWQGAILGLGVIVLLCALLGLLYKPLKTQKVKKGKTVATDIPDGKKLEKIDSTIQMNKKVEKSTHDDGLSVLMVRPPTTFTIQITASEKMPHLPPSENYPVFDTTAAFVKTDNSFIEEWSCKNAACYDNNFHTPECTNNLGFLGGQMSTTSATIACKDAEMKSGEKLNMSKNETKIVDFSLWFSPSIIVLGVSSMFSVGGMLIPFVYFMDQARFALTKGEIIPDKDMLTLLLSLIGAANTIGRIISGWVADRPFINTLSLNNGAVALMGMSTVVVPFLQEYYEFVVYSGVFGLSTACFVSLRSILIVELFGVAKLTDAYGLILLFEGIGATVATPLAGTIVELSMEAEDFSIAFYLSGGSLLFSAFLYHQLKRILKWERSRQTMRSNNA